MRKQLLAFVATLAFAGAAQTGAQPQLISRMDKTVMRTHAAQPFACWV